MIFFDWDPAKADRNQRKHGVSFELAAQVFDDPFALSRVDERFDYEEDRWVTMGIVQGVVVLVVAHTSQDEVDGELTVRIISARRATRKEKAVYEQAHH